MKQMYILLLLCVPAIEIWLFIALGGKIGPLLTIIMCVITAGIGIALVRLQGMLALKDFANQTKSPATLMVEGGLLLISGISLLIPGFFSDAIGFTLLIPAVRRMLSANIKNRIKPRPPPMGATIIDAEYSVYEEAEEKKNVQHLHSAQDSSWLSKNNNT